MSEVPFLDTFGDGEALMTLLNLYCKLVQLGKKLNAILLVLCISITSSALCIM